MNSGNDREQQALDALLVSQLRKQGCEEHEVDPAELPELTHEERAALKSLGSGLVERLSARASQPASPHRPARSSQEATLSEPAFGLNRAEEVEPETLDELAKQRQEIIDRFRRKRRESGGA